MAGCIDGGGASTSSKIAGTVRGGDGQSFRLYGETNTVGTQIRRYEIGERPIPPWIARLAYMYGKFGLPEEFRDRWS